MGWFFLLIFSSFLFSLFSADNLFRSWPPEGAVDILSGEKDTARRMANANLSHRPAIDPTSRRKWCLRNVHQTAANMFHVYFTLLWKHQHGRLHRLRESRVWESQATLLPQQSKQFKTRFRQESDNGDNQNNGMKERQTQLSWDNWLSPIVMAIQRSKAQRKRAFLWICLKRLTVSLSLAWKTLKHKEKLFSLHIYEAWCPSIVPRPTSPSDKLDIFRPFQLPSVFSFCKSHVPQNESCRTSSVPVSPFGRTEEVKWNCIRLGIRGSFISKGKVAAHWRHRSSIVCKDAGCCISSAPSCC